MPQKLEEEKLYPSVEVLLKSDVFGCFKTAKKKGTVFVGQADVVGVREIGGDVRGDIEVIAVEVKSSPQPFGKNLGQALGYSLLAHKCYLAAPTRFSLEQKELATRLGVGLIEIKRYRSDWKCVHVLSSGNHTPHPHQMETMLRRGLKVIRCGFCGIFIDTEGEKITNSWDVAREKGKIYRILREPKRKLLFSKRRKEDWRRIYLCKECVQELWAGIALETEDESPN